MIISAIVAVAKNGVIGKNNALPWRIRTDMKYFKNVTMGHCVIMGRKNFDSIDKKPLSGRTNIIITHQRDLMAEGCIVVHSLEQALEYCRQQNEMEAFVIGGSEIFKMALPICNKLYITEVEAEVEGDVIFPAWNPAEWDLVFSEKHEASENDQYPFIIKVFQRP